MDGETHILVGPDLDGDRNHRVDHWRKSIVGQRPSIPQSMLPPEQAELDTCWLVQIRGANKKEGGEGGIFAQRPWLFRPGYRGKKVLSGRSSG